MDDNSSTTKEIIKSLHDLIQDQEHSHSIWSKFFAAFWGSAVFHFALLLKKLGDLFALQTKVRSALPQTEPDALINLAININRVFNFLTDVLSLPLLSIVVILYSLTFGLTVAVSKPKSSLVRHFVYGALLPAVAYALAGRF